MVWWWWEVRVASQEEPGSLSQVVPVRVDSDKARCWQAPLVGSDENDTSLLWVSFP